MGESNAGVIILSILLVVALAGAGYLFYEKKGLEEELKTTEMQLKAYENIPLNKVTINADGEPSYLKWDRVYVSEEGKDYPFPYASTYNYMITYDGDETVTVTIGDPQPKENLSAFSLCYELKYADFQARDGDTTGSSLHITLKNSFSKGFYEHCEGYYTFPILFDGEERASFDLLLKPVGQEE